MQNSFSFKMAFSCCLCQELINSHLEYSYSGTQNNRQDKLFVVTKCGHLFHLEPCLKDWVSGPDAEDWKNNTCPECNQAITFQTDIIRINSNPSSKLPRPNQYNEDLILCIQKLQLRQEELTSEIEKLNRENEEYRRNFGKIVQDYSRLQLLNQPNLNNKSLAMNDMNRTSAPNMHQNYDLLSRTDGADVPLQGLSISSLNGVAEIFEKQISLTEEESTFDYEQEIFNNLLLSDEFSYKNFNDDDTSKDGFNEPLSIFTKIDLLRNIWESNNSTPSLDLNNSNSESSNSNVQSTNGNDTEPKDSKLSTSIEESPEYFEQATQSPTTRRLQKKTPYQGIKQVYGKYSCSNPKCNAKWGSLRSYANQAQLCKFCNTPTFPYVQAPLILKHKPENRLGQPFQ